MKPSFRFASPDRRAAAPRTAVCFCREMEKNLVLYGILCYTKINVPRAAGRGQERMSGYVSRSGKSRYGTDLDIYARAREFMAKNGNSTQWGDNYPSPELLEEDIDTNRLFVYMVNGRMQAVFAFVLGEDPTYKVIEDGQWLNDTLPYGTLHRLASAGESKGIGKAVVEWCLEHCESLRADTPRRQQGDAAPAGSEALPAAASSMWRTAPRASPTSGCP